MKQPNMNATSASAMAESPAASSQVLEDEDPGQVPVVCTLCGGPARLCGGVRYCLGGPTSDAERRWVVAIRAVYAGLLLTRTPAALWGGALLRLARQLARAPSPVGVAHLAAEYANPCCPLSPTFAAWRAIAYLQHGDIAWLHELEPLRDAQAPWLAVVCALGERAALATPLEGKRFGLIAVLCDRCAARSRSDLAISQLAVHVATYDAAIRCPKCGTVAPHPLPKIEIGEPHPVARCVATASRRCLAHQGGELDANGLCPDGQAIYGRAITEVAFNGSPTARNRDVIDALLRAQRWRREVLPALFAVLTALAKASLETANRAGAR